MQIGMYDAHTHALLAEGHADVVNGVCEWPKTWPDPTPDVYVMGVRADGTLRPVISWAVTTPV